jgi:Arc/MetJ-type ribon-helix-helix transcriptional regulator
MTVGMTKLKIAVSIPEPLVRVARKAIRRGAAASMSAYVSAALEQKSKLDNLEAMLNEALVESGGPLTAAELQAADRALKLGSGVRRRHR